MYKMYNGEGMKLGKFKQFIAKHKKPHKKRLSFALNNKLKVSGIIIGVLATLILVISLITGKNLVVLGAKKILNRLGVYTEQIKKVEIQSSDYDNPGSWHIDKSAKWIGEGKVLVTFDVNSIMKTDGNKKDIILVLDRSGSMEGEKLTKAISDAKDLVSRVLSDNQNNVAIVTFESSSEIVSAFSNDKNNLLTKLDSIIVEGNTNYNAALQNVDIVMNGYTKQSDRDVVALFLTDGYPNEDTPNQVGTYQVLKDKYPYMDINGVQYEMGIDVIDEIKQITDNQWVADQSTLDNVLLEASVTPKVYEDFVVTDYIDDDYYDISSVDDIKVTKGTVSLDGNKITWNLGNNSYVSGGNEKMTIDLSLKQQYIENKGFYPTNKSEKVDYKLEGDTSKTINSANTPVLKNDYEVVYDTNTPDGCNLEDISNEKHHVYENVTKKTTQLSCDGYLFKGWEIEDESDIKKLNDDVFVMPGRDVTIRGVWSKQDIAKSMDGTVHEKQTLYKVLETEATMSGGLARRYTKSHKDSMDISKSTQKIYYYYGSNATNGTAILNKNNVIFGDHCWQMIRTTDTGGVKMIYNGEAVNNQCLSTRGAHVGYVSHTTQNLASTYWYGTDYTYDSTTKTFKVSGTTEQATWSDSTSTSLIGKYTCKLTSEDGTCTKLYLIESYDSNTNAYVIPLNSNANYSQFGVLQFNTNKESPADVGYMYNIRYTYDSKYMTNTETMLSYKSLATTYWYADNVNWDTTVNKYSLDNPIQIASTTDYSSLVGKYTFGNTSETYTDTSVQYIAAVNNTNYYYIELGNESDSTHDLSFYNYTYTYGDSYTNNGNGTYTINNATTINRSDWFTNYSNVKNKYVCKNAVNDTCSDLWYVRSSSAISMTYIKVANNYKYAKGFTWDGSKYILDNDTSVTFFEWNDTNKKKIDNAHYTCWNETGECTSVSYIYYLSDISPYYVNLRNGESIDDVINEMLYNNDVNQINSTIKSGVDAWYKHYLLENYDDYIEDTIFCNDRSLRTLNGWNPNGGTASSSMYFKEYFVSSDLICTNATDQFSVSNNKAQLTYKVGLMSSPEMELLNNSNARKTGQNYWLASPYCFDVLGSVGRDLDRYGNNNHMYSVDYVIGVRPAISLRPGIEYSDGNGSMENPYIVDLGD